MSEWWWIALAFFGMPILSGGYVWALRQWWARRRCEHYYSTSRPDFCLFCDDRRPDEIG